MKRFCRECGKEASSEDKVCIHCGAPLPDKAIKEKESLTKKEPMPRKRKILFISLSAIIILFISFTMWAKSYQSPEAVEKRFAKAVAEKNAAGMKKLLVHEDGSPATTSEAKALLALLEEEALSDVEDLFTVEPHGKFLFLFTANKIEAVDQFVVYPDIVEGLSFLFNGKEIPESERDKHQVIYGPLIPGLYETEAVFKGKYGKTKKEGLLTLSDITGEETLLNMDVNVAKVTFHVENYEDFDLKESFIKLGDEKISLDKKGNTDELGPFLLDGSQKVQTVVPMPWGEVTSEAIDIDDPEMTIHADLLSEKHFSELEDTLGTFGEQYVEAMATDDTAPIKSVSEDVKLFVENGMIDDWFYSGQFEQVAFDRHSVQVENKSKQPEIKVLAEYTFNESNHDYDEEPELNESSSLLALKLSYDGDKKTWKIISIESADVWKDFTATDTVAGSKKLHKPGAEAVKQADNNKLKEELDYFFQSYTQASVDAINYRDFYYVEDYIASGSPRWKEAKEYIDYLDSKDITEDWLDSTVESVKETGDNTWELTVTESFTIYKPDSSSDKTFETKVVIKKIDGDYQVYELLETNEV